MSPFTLENIESELSYAYLHAVASKAGISCKVAGRHEDNTGVDAQLVGWGPFPNGGWRQEVDLKIQLKATIKQPTTVGNSLSYSLSGITRYNDLRSEALATPRILVVLFLPENADSWITHTDDALSLHRCAYWVSLRGAKPSENKTAQTVYLPKAQRFDAEGLTSLIATLSRNEIPTYREIEA
jgi:hypothetical protein